MIDPVAFSIGPLSIHWYGIAYAVSLMICLWILILLNKKRPLFKDNDQIFNLVFWIFLLGVILGGRLGYILFYNLPFYLSNPAKMLAVWEGGMSFHGGLIASIIVGIIYCKKHKINIPKAADLVIIPGALAPMLIRIANFINQELVGRVIESPKWEWLGVDFGDGLLRYPSQLFQSANALIVFLILLFIFSKKPRTGVLLSSYFLLQGVFRFVTEFTREPDAQIGFLFNYLTLGQLFSLGMVIVGIILLTKLKKA